jgi:hypothetical protein
MGLPIGSELADLLLDYGRYNWGANSIDRSSSGNSSNGGQRLRLRGLAKGSFELWVAYRRQKQILTINSVTAPTLRAPVSFLRCNSSVESIVRVHREAGASHNAHGVEGEATQDL